MYQIGVVLLGLCIGSFLNVCIERIPHNQSIVYPPSHCGYCKHPLSPLELIPIISYIGLRGRCKACHHPLSIQYPIVEGMTAILFLWLYNQWGISIETIEGWTFISFGMVLAWIDGYTMRLPTSIIMGAMGVIGIQKVVELWISMDWMPIISSLLGALWGYSVFKVLSVVGRLGLKKEALGGGDVRFMGLIGLCVGFEKVQYAIFIGASLGTIYGIGLYLYKKKSILFPLGPFLYCGACMTLLQ